LPFDQLVDDAGYGSEADHLFGRDPLSSTG